ncbi:MAG: glycosyltransferase [Anaerolineae bacterium]|nr:glycosyltransferase [Anaerolineae bacterium]
MIRPSWYRVATIFFSIILPIFNASSEISATLASLSQQPGEFEVIVAHRPSVVGAKAPDDYRLEMVHCPDVSRGALLNIGAANATGDIFLFLWPGCRLPDKALPAIEANFEVLPQAVGGNFHVTFDDASRLAQGLKLLLKRWRYHGRYFGHSGIFVRREIFEALGGFRDYDLLEDYDFAQRLEKQGATLFLPHYITASAQTFQNRKLRAAISWIVIYALYRLGVSPNELVNFHYG